MRVEAPNDYKPLTLHFLTPYVHPTPYQPFLSGAEIAYGRDGHCSSWRHREKGRDGFLDEHFARRARLHLPSAFEVSCPELNKEDVRFVRQACLESRDLQRLGACRGRGTL